MSMLSFLLLSLFASVSVCSLQLVDGALRLPNFVADHMVLQRFPQRARIWGWTSTLTGVTITASMDGQPIGSTKVPAVSSSNEDEIYWEIQLEPQPPSVNKEIVIAESSGSSALLLKDVAFGDVYLCSGQSNMEMAVSAVFDAEEEINDSVNYPNLRLASVQRTVANSTQDDVAPRGPQSWWRSGPGAFIEGNGFGYFSAACYFAGRDVYKALDGLVPIGLLASTWGGQPVEAFSSPEALNDPSCGGVVRASPLHDGANSLRAEAISNSMVSIDVSARPQPTQLWYGMITPLLPMRLSGILWYQGEANANDPSSYACRFPAMITDWRKHFGISDIPFFYVQLAAFQSDYSWLRSAQGAALDLERVRVALAIDVGDPTSPWGAVHSRRKQEVGRRLALDILHEVYGIGAGSMGPTLDDIGVLVTSTKSQEETQLRLQLQGAPSPVMQGTAGCSECCYELPFETLDASTGNWTRVTGHAALEDNELLLHAKGDVVGVRYGWEGYPQCAVYDASHHLLPMAPFKWCKYEGELPPWTRDSCKLTPYALDFGSKHQWQQKSVVDGSMILLRGRSK